MTLDAPVFRDPTGSTYAERCAALLGYYADRSGTERPAPGAIEAAACLALDRPLDTVLPLLDRLIKDPAGDMFWMVPAALVHHVGQGRLPDDVLARLRACWRTYTPYRGDTENHWLQYYAALYLLAELYPDDPAETWFNGRSAAENRAEAAGWLAHWTDLTTSRGQGEFSSPHYLPFFLAPLALLVGFAADPEVRTRAAMMLDFLAVDFAVDTLGGLYAGAFSRIYPEPTLERWRNGSTTFAWLLFGNVPFRPDAINVVLDRPGYRPHGLAVALALSGYRPPEVIRRIATDRSRPALHRQLKRTRHRLRYADTRDGPVYKTGYVRKEYAVGSVQGGLLQPIQQHTWEVLWATADPHAGYNVLFTLHPYAEPREVATYFPEEPELLVDDVALHEKDTYDRPDKWTGGSPYEHVVQHESAVVVLYRIAPGTRFGHVSGYFSRTLVGLAERSSGWIVARGGDALVAYFPLAPFEWRREPGGDRRLHSPHLHNGAVVQVAPAGAFASLGAFAEAVEALPLDVAMNPVPLVRFTTLGGARLDVTYGETPRVDGVPLDYAAWPLFGGPHLQAERDGRRLTIRHGSLCRTLDFSTLTTRDC